MWRFMFVTFAFLGWSFFQLSGGADYAPAPGSRQAVTALQAQDRAVETVHLAQSAQPTPQAASVSTTPDTQVVLASARQPNPAEKRVRLTLNADAPKPQPIKTTENGVTVTTVAANAAKIAQLVRADVAKPKAQNASPKTADTADKDIREVKGTRVNMRQGPSTNYSVVARLTKGTRVEVLRDDGDGWVKLRVMDTDRTGWMADFLLIAGN